MFVSTRAMRAEAKSMAEGNLFKSFTTARSHMAALRCDTDLESTPRFYARWIAVLRAELKRRGERV